MNVTIDITYFLRGKSIIYESKSDYTLIYYNYKKLIFEINLNQNKHMHIDFCKRIDNKHVTILKG